MDDSDLRKRIEDGSYFTDAYEWYERKYLSPLFERTWLIITTVIVAITFSWSILNIANLLKNNNQEYPVVIKSDNTTDYFSVIKNLTETNDDKFAASKGDTCLKSINTRGETPQELVTQYLLCYYVELRENYDPRKISAGHLRQELKHIRSVSSKDVLKEYQAYIDENNPYSPLNRFGKSINREVEVQEVSFLNDDPFSGKAEVTFKAKTQKGNEAPKESLWLATIHYRLPDVNIVAQTGAPLRFVVRYYRIRPL